MATPFIFNTPVGTSGYSGVSGYTNTYPVISASVVDTPTTSAVTINWATSNTHYITLSSSLTAVNFSNATDGQLINLFITNPSTYTVSWPLTSILWNSGVAPTASTGSTTTPKTDRYQFQYIQGSYYATPFQTYYIAFNNFIVATGGTLTTGNGYNQWTFNSSGTWTVTSPGIAYYAIVAGGGGGGGGLGARANGSGGGGGGVVTGILSVNTGTYSITVGSGGAQNTSGTNTMFGSLTAIGGGGSVASQIGYSGGSGAGNNSAVGVPGGYGIASQGWNGGIITNSGGGVYGAAGGGGAGWYGGSGNTSTPGNGGPGLSIYFPASGVSTYVGGGGGGASSSITSSGGIGGGGSGGGYSSGLISAGNGVANTGGGAGGGNNAGSAPGGTGGSGVVYIWSPTASTTKTPYVNYLVVAGGGGGGSGGGGGGGILTGIVQINSAVAYTVTVGGGGTGGTGPSGSFRNGSNGVDSAITGTGITSISALGGGGGGFGDGGSTGPGQSGGSGGGASASSVSTLNGGAGTQGQGYYGGNQISTSSPYPATGGGGYGAIGGNGSGSQSGAGGDGGTFGIANGTGLNWSNKFNGTTDYITTPANTAFAFGTGDFTVEAWLFVTALNGSSSFGGQIAGCQIYGTSADWLFCLTATNYLYFQIGSGASGALTSSSAVPLKTWTHVALVRVSGVVTIFINGTNVSSATYSSNITNASTPFSFGGPSNGSALGLLYGYISNLRVVKGTAVYTSNFTPSTTPLTAITNTSLLTCQTGSFIDTSSNNFTLTNSGTPYIASQNPFGVSYAGGGGGGGGGGSATIGLGGMGGGGNGSAIGTGNNGSANTGGGGGGISNISPQTGTTGGSGIVVLSYPSSYPVAASTTGSPSLSTINGNNIYKFTSSGSITF
jgi:Concanavalin A-like lectin/glucanases superfamily